MAIALPRQVEVPERNLLNRGEWEGDHGPPPRMLIAEAGVGANGRGEDANCSEAFARLVS